MVMECPRNVGIVKSDGDLEYGSRSFGAFANPRGLVLNSFPVHVVELTSGKCFEERPNGDALLVAIQVRGVPVKMTFDRKLEDENICWRKKAVR